MSLYFNIISRKNIEHPDQPNLYYPALKSIGMMDQKQVAEQAAIGTSMNPHEIMMGVQLTTEAQLGMLLNGYSAAIGNLGWLYLTSQGRGKPNPDQLSAFDITKVNLHIKPSAETISRLKQATFIPLDRIVG